MKNNSLVLALALLIAVLFLAGCEKEKPEPPDPPTVTTASISNITQTSAEGGGNVTSDGESTVTARGVCWS